MFNFIFPIGNILLFPVVIEAKAGMVAVLPRFACLA
jgi:hypothetical protein